MIQLFCSNLLASTSYHWLLLFRLLPCLPSGASFRIHAVTCKSMKHERCCLEVCSFCDAVAALHGGSSLKVITHEWQHTSDDISVTRSPSFLHIGPLNYSNPNERKCMVFSLASMLHIWLPTFCWVPQDPSPKAFFYLLIVYSKYDIFYIKYYNIIKPMTEYH